MQLRKRDCAAHAPAQRRAKIRFCNSWRHGHQTFCHMMRRANAKRAVNGAQCLRPTISSVTSFAMLHDCCAEADPLCASRHGEVAYGCKTEACVCVRLMPHTCSHTIHAEGCVRVWLQDTVEQKDVPSRHAIPFGYHKPLTVAISDPTPPQVGNTANDAIVAPMR